MNVFDDYMMSIYLQYNLVLAVVLIFFGVQLAWWIPKGWIAGAAGFFASMIGAVTVAAVAIVVMLLSKGGALIREPVCSHGHTKPGQSLRRSQSFFVQSLS